MGSLELNYDLFVREIRQQRAGENLFRTDF